MRKYRKIVPQTPYSETCMVESAINGKQVEGVVSRFRENENLEVIINRSVKLQMRWTGRVYEGSAAGMSFTSTGPKLGKL